MAITKHIPDETSGPIGSAFLGYPLGVWPHTISAFCDPSLEDLRHQDCSVPGCACSCHAVEPEWGAWNRLVQRKPEELSAGVHRSDSRGTEQLRRLEGLGENHDSTRILPGVDWRAFARVRREGGCMNILVFIRLLIASTTIAYLWTPLAFKPVLAMAQGGISLEKLQRV